MSNWILDALKEPFSKKKGKEPSKEEQLKEIEKYKIILAEKEAKLMAKEEIKTEEIPLPPKFEEPKQEQTVELAEGVEITTERKLEILESNLQVIVNNIHNRLTTIESFLFRNKN